MNIEESAVFESQILGFVYGEFLARTSYHDMQVISTCECILNMYLKNHSLF